MNTGNRKSGNEPWEQSCNILNECKQKKNYSADDMNALVGTTQDCRKSDSAFQRLKN